MKIIPMVKRCILAAPLALSLLTAAPAFAQGDGPFSQCLEEFAGQADAFEACLIEHEVELQASYDLPADWMSRLHAYLQAHPDGWDRIEDVGDRLENSWDRRENVRDRHENWIDTWEDRHDDDTNLKDVFDRLEDARDRAENRWDRRENARDRIENRWDRRN